MMKAFVQALSWAVIATATAAASVRAQGDTAKVPLDVIVLKVGNVAITYVDVMERVVRNRQASRQTSDPSPQELRALLDSAFAELLDEELLIAKGKDLKIELAESEILPLAAQEFQQRRSQFPTQPEFEAALASAGMGTPDDFRRFISSTIRRQMMIDRTMAQLRGEQKMVPVNVTDADIAEQFDAMKSMMPKRQALYSWKQMVIAPTPDPVAWARLRSKADSLYQEIKSGGDFARVAKRESMDRLTKDLGGDRGWASRGMYEPQFDAIAFGTTMTAPLKPGDVSRPVETPPIGIHLYKIERVQPGQVKSSHILLRPEIDSAAIKRVAKLADSVAQLIRDGAAFDTLTKYYHDYPANESAGLISDYPRDSMPPAYTDAFAKAKPGDIVRFALPGEVGEVTKEIVAQLVEFKPPGDMTMAEVKEELRQHLAMVGATRRYLDRLRKEFYVVEYRDRMYTMAARR
jgi:parvulin-like peptidyl-prolyl isomerase